MKRFAPWIFVALAYAIAVYVVNAKAAEPHFTAPQAQASALAVPSPEPAQPSSVISVVQCNKLVALAVVDVESKIHPVNLEGLSGGDAMKIMQTVPADRVIAINVGCPGDPARDTTIF